MKDWPMQRKHGPWTILERTRRFCDPYIDVCQDRVIQPDGEPGSYSTVVMKPGVVVLPIDDEGNTYLVRQFRYAIGRESLETACGGIDEGETPEEAARKELREELGIEAREWTDLGGIDLDTSMVRCAMRLYLARDLSFRETDHECTEVIQPLKMPFAEALRQALDSRITHAASVALILKAARVLEAHTGA